MPDLDKLILLAITSLDAKTSHHLIIIDSFHDEFQGRSNLLTRRGSGSTFRLHFPSETRRK